MAVWRDQRPADLGDLALMSRRFPPPWSVEELDPKLERQCFIVRDANGQARSAERASGIRQVEGATPVSRSCHPRELLC